MNFPGIIPASCIVLFFSVFLFTKPCVWKRDAVVYTLMKTGNSASNQYTCPHLLLRFVNSPGFTEILLDFPSLIRKK